MAVIIQFFLTTALVLGVSDGLFNVVLNSVAIVFVLHLDNYVDIDLRPDAEDALTLFVPRYIRLRLITSRGPPTPLRATPGQPVRLDYDASGYS